VGAPSVERGKIILTLFLPEGGPRFAFLAKCGPLRTCLRLTLFYWTGSNPNQFPAHRLSETKSRSKAILRIRPIRSTVERVCGLPAIYPGITDALVLEQARRASEVRSCGDVFCARERRAYRKGNGRVRQRRLRYCKRLRSRRKTEPWCCWCHRS
jgi:hypothetical protein